MNRLTIGAFLISMVGLAAHAADTPAPAANANAPSRNFIVASLVIWRHGEVADSRRPSLPSTHSPANRSMNGDIDAHGLPAPQ